MVQIGLGHVELVEIGEQRADCGIHGRDLIRPRDSGGGGPPCAAGWWRGRGRQRDFDDARLSVDDELDESFDALSVSISSPFTLLQRQRSSEPCAPSFALRISRQRNHRICGSIRPACHGPCCGDGLHSSDGGYRKMGATRSTSRYWLRSCSEQQGRENTPPGRSLFRSLSGAKPTSAGPAQNDANDRYC